MKKKLLISSILFTLILLFCKQDSMAAVVPYSDDIVSFEYDDTFSGLIQKKSYENSLCYSFNTNVKQYQLYKTSVSIIVQFINEDELQSQGFVNWKDEFLNKEVSGDVTKTILDDGEYPEKKLEINDRYYFVSKVLAYTDDTYMYKVLTVYDEDLDEADFFKNVYDSIKASETYSEVDFTADEDEETILFSNAIYSEQVKKYAEEAISVGNGYLDFSISQKDAIEKLDELYNRSKTYALHSSFFYDSQIESTIYSIQYGIENFDDGYVMDRIDELLRAIQNG